MSACCKCFILCIDDVADGFAFSSFVHCSYELSHTLSAEAFSRLIMIGSLQLGDVFMAQRPPK